MIYGEQTECRMLDQDGKGLTGRIVYRCDWDDVDPAPIEGLPKYGDPWVSVSGRINNFLCCVHAHAEEGPAGTCLWEADFSTRGELAEAYYETSLEIGSEPGPAMTGLKYQSTGTPATDIPPRPISVGTFSVKIRRDMPPYYIVRTAVDHVNDRTFLGFPKGAVLFLGANADNSVGISGDVLSSGVAYKFSIRDLEHNYFYRQPLQARDANGDPLFWQNIDAKQPFYTTDMTKIATPVRVNQVPGSESNPAGTGGWDKVVDDSGNPYYPEADFAAILDMPGASPSS